MIGADTGDMRVEKPALNTRAYRSGVATLPETRCRRDMMAYLLHTHHHLPIGEIASAFRLSRRQLIRRFQAIREARELDGERLA